MQNNWTTWDGLLSDMHRQGWQPGMENSPAARQASGREAAMAAADALLRYWQDDPTLANYAHQLNGSSALFGRDEDKTALMNALNKGYIAARQQDPPRSVAQTYEELRFWEGLNSKEGLAYFARLSDLFVTQVLEESEVGPELTELLQSRDLSPQMRDLRRQTVEAMRRQLPAWLNQERMPVKRLRLLIDVMSGVGGVRLVDENMWNQAADWALPAAQLSADNYVALRNILTGAMDGELLDHPREALARIEGLLRSMDKSVDYGSDLEPNTMLTYWRGQAFDGLPDESLLRLYTAYLKQNPQGQPLIARDLPLVEGRENPQINALLQPAQEETAAGGRGRQPRAGKDRYTVAEGDGRERRAPGKMSGKLRGGIILLCIVVVALIVLILSDPNSGEKIREERESRTSEPTSTPRREEREEEPTPAPTETEESTPEPSEEATPSPTPEETAAEEEIEVEGEALSEEEGLEEVGEEVPYEEPEGGEEPPEDGDAPPEE